MFWCRDMRDMCVFKLGGEQGTWNSCHLAHSIIYFVQHKGNTSHPLRKIPLIQYLYILYETKVSCFFLTILASYCSLNGPMPFGTDPTALKCEPWEHMIGQIFVWGHEKECAKLLVKAGEIIPVKHTYCRVPM